MTWIKWPEEPDWHLGVTGSRNRYDPEQEIKFPTVDQMIGMGQFLDEAMDHGLKYVHHGCCTGWDEHAVRLCRGAKLDVLIYAYPPKDERHLSRYAMEASDVVHKPQEYRVRDAEIAAQADIILAGPAWPELDPRSKRSGTWMTVRFARAVGARVYAYDPSGTIRDITEAA